MDSCPIYWRKKEVLELHISEGGLGIRRFDALNIAMLGNQAWRLHSNHTLLASRMFRGKYGEDSVTIGYRGSCLKNASWAARSMVKSLARLKGGIRRTIGSGETVDAMGEVWTAMGHIHRKPGLSHDIPIKWVADHINQY